MKSPVPYLGAKRELASAIVGLMPPHKTYVELFGGGGSVLVAKPPVSVEVFNDLDGDLMSFWRVLRDHRDELVEACALTPYSRAEFECAQLDTVELSDVERARRVWVRLQQSFSHTTASSSGWSTSTRRWPSMAVTVRNRLGLLGPVADRLASVMLECRPAIEIAERYAGVEDAVLYADPTYLPETRKTRNGGEVVASDYGREMTVTDHVELAAVLRGCAGTVLVSGYNSDLYRDLYSDWERVEWSVTVRMHRGSGDRRRTAVECVWVCVCVCV